MWEGEGDREEVAAEIPQPRLPSLTCKHEDPNNTNIYNNMVISHPNKVKVL